MDYDVVRVVDARERSDIEPEAAALGITVVPLDDLARVAGERTAEAAAVVASQGHYDEEALEARPQGRRAVRRPGRVAQTRARPCGACSKQRASRASRPMRNPAGLDLGGRTAAEIALSILAEIVQQQASERRKQPPASAPAAATSAIDPVCGMSVEYRDGAPHGGSRRRHVLLLLRATAARRF